MATRRSLRPLSVFLDTNVVVYAYDDADPAKQLRAQSILRGGGWVISTQVLQEFFVATTRRMDVPLHPDHALQVLDELGRSAVVSIDAPMVSAAAETAINRQISLWDALIIAAAARAGCECVLTEDLNNGQTIMGVVVENPFT